jgi:hypothetical protein
MSSRLDMATGGNASVEAEREIFGDGMVEKDSDSPASGKDGMGGEMEERWGEATGADDGADEANMK